MRPLGLDLPVYPVKGYSLTLPIVDEAAAPVSTVMDETYKVAITRLGDRIRVGGLAEIAGFDLSLPAARARHAGPFGRGAVRRRRRPGAAPTFWCGLRPMTPDGTPVVGRTPVPGLWLNTGHGTLGWTMAAGSGAGARGPHVGRARRDRIGRPRHRPLRPRRARRAAACRPQAA